MLAGPAVEVSSSSVELVEADVVVFGSEFEVMVVVGGLGTAAWSEEGVVEMLVSGFELSVAETALVVAEVWAANIEIPSWLRQNLRL